MSITPTIHPTITSIDAAAAINDGYHDTQCQQERLSTTTMTTSMHDHDNYQRRQRHDRELWRQREQ